MKIKFIDIQNYRKLKSTRIYLSDDETIFVGANNSGKTSALDALIIFLDQNTKTRTDDKDSTDDEVKSNRRFFTTDFTLSNWGALNRFAESWVGKEDIKGDTSCLH